MAQGHYMSCSYEDVNITKYDFLANKFNLRPKVWKRFRDDLFVLWGYGTASLLLFLRYLNSMDKAGKINFTMEIANGTGLEFFDLKLKIIESKIKVDIFPKPTNRFCTTPSTCSPQKNIHYS